MRSIRAFVSISVGAMLALVSACGSSPQGTQASIGPSGGTLSLASPAVQFDVPAGALQTTTTVSLRASAEPGSLLITLEPAQLTLSEPGQLSASMSGAQHISSVTEVTHGGEQPIGVDTRIEDATGATASLHLDHLTQIRMRTSDGADGGPAPGACRRHEGEDGDDDDGHRDAGMDGGDHQDVERLDGGMDVERLDGGVPGPTDCPLGFECDDGVCVVHGGNHEHDGCPNADGGTCPDDDGDGDHDGDHRDGGHD
jgi:hypothetical protein